MKLIGIITFLFLFGISGGTQAQESNKTVVLKGQIACALCWTEADRKTVRYGSAEDLTCATDCKMEGKPTVLAVNWDGDATLYQLEYGKLKKSKPGWLDYTAKIVEVTGTISNRNGKHYLKVDEIKIVGDNPAAQALAAATGSPAPELSLKDIIGAQQSLSSYRGKIVVLNFWATWCEPCKAEMPVFVKVQNSYAAFGVQIIGASADEASNQAAVVKFVRNQQINFPIWLGATTVHLADFGLGAALPGTVIIDRDGKIAAIFSGVITEAQLKEKIDALLAIPVKQAETKKQDEKIVAVSKSSSVPS
jgi:peroxiredoxin